MTIHLSLENILLVIYNCTVLLVRLVTMKLTNLKRSMTKKVITILRKLLYGYTFDHAPSWRFGPFNQKFCVRP